MPCWDGPDLRRGSSLQAHQDLTALVPVLQLPCGGEREMGPQRQHRGGQVQAGSPQCWG